MFERFSERAIKAVVLAQQECRRYSHNSVGSEHMLLGLMGEGTGIAARALKSRVSITDLREKIESLVGRGMSPPAIEIPFTPRVKAALQAATEESETLGHAEVDTGHMLFAMLPGSDVDGNSGSVATRALEDLGVDCAQLRLQVLEFLKSPPPNLEPEAKSDEIVFAPIEGRKESLCPHCRVSMKLGAVVCGNCSRHPGDRYERCKMCAEFIIDTAVICRYCSSKRESA